MITGLTKVSLLVCVTVSVSAIPLAAQTPPAGRVTIAAVDSFAYVNLVCFECDVVQVLTAPGSVTAQNTGFNGESATATLTLNVAASASGEIQRIEFIASATAHAGTSFQSTVASLKAHVDLLVTATVRATITERIQTIRNGVIILNTNTTQTQVFTPGQHAVEGLLPFCSAFSFTGTVPTGSATCSFTIEIERRPVLVIPGIVGTYAANTTNDLDWLRQRGADPSDLQIDPLARSYNDLVQTLRNVGYQDGKDLFVVNYDWRLSPGRDAGSTDGQIGGITAASITRRNFQTGVDYLGDILKQAAERWAVDHPGEPPLDAVDVVAHSTGGLVARAYIQSAAYGGDYAAGKPLPKINNMIMVGVPNRGASKAWNPLLDNWVVDPAFQMVLSKIIDRAYQQILKGEVIFGPDHVISLASVQPPQCLDLPEVCFINLYVPTARSLLATYDFIDFGAGYTNVNGVAGLRNSLLLDLNGGSDPLAFTSSSNVTVICGTNAELSGGVPGTPKLVIQRFGPARDVIASFADFLARDAHPNEIYFEDVQPLASGDGTVPLISCFDTFAGDARVHLTSFTMGAGGNTSDSVGHVALMSNRDVQKAILNALGVPFRDPADIKTGLANLSATLACAVQGCLNFLADPVEGILVDGQGRRLGYSAATGPLTEIPDSVWFGQADGIGWAFGAPEEPLSLQLRGLGGPYYVAVSALSPTRVGGLIDSGFLAPGAPKVLPIPLSDPSSPGTDADQVAPVTTAAPSPQPNPAGWNNSDVVIALSAADEAGGSGVKNITVSTSGSQAIAETTVAGTSAVVTISAEGQTTVRFFATDNAGNAEQPRIVTINLDKTPPTIDGSVTPSPNSNGWNNTDVVVSFQCRDALSGVDAGSVPANTVVSSEGANQSVGGACQDIAGNAASTTVNRINVDKTAPAVSCGTNPSSLWPPDHRLVTITASVLVTDAHSGPAGFILESITSDEPDAGGGSGDTSNDIQGFAIGTPGTTGQIRAERAGGGLGRV